MKKTDFYLKAIKEGCYKKRDWVMSVFCLQQQTPDSYKADPYPFRVVQTPTGHFFVNENKELELIEDAIPTAAIMRMNTPIQLKAKDLANVDKDTLTTAGNILFNCCSIIEPFGTKIPFLTGKVSVSKVEALIAPRLKSTPSDNQPRDDKYIYVDEYLQFCDSFNYLTEFTQVCTQALTEKAITQAPGTIELRNKLIEENKEHLDDPLVVAKIEKALLEHDAQYLKGDPSEDFLISKKSRGTARRKLFLDYGSDVGLIDTFKADMIPKSLSEGWQVEKMPTMINVLRAGSYNRGAETQLGGEAVKWLYRASSNINFIDTDCGSTVGYLVHVTDATLNKIKQKRIITGDTTHLVETDEDAKSYLGKHVYVRSPMYCKLKHTDWCRYCLGEKLGSNPNAGAIAISRLGSVFMALSLKAFHSSGVSVASTQLDAILS